MLIGRYKTLSLLARGGSGEVYLAIDPEEPERRVAIKLFRGSCPSRNILREAQLLSTLYHPHIVELLDWGTTRGGRRGYLVTEYIDGLDLVSVAEDFPLNKKIGLLLDLALALDFIHTRHILHLDLKSENILISPDDRLQIVDFGLGRNFLKGRARQAAGSLVVMAPEILQGKKPSVAADYYAFGILAWRLLNGRYPFNEKKPDEITRFHLYQKPEWPAGTKVPTSLINSILTCLAKNPADRFSRGIEIAKVWVKAGLAKRDLKSLGILSSADEREVIRHVDDFSKEMESVLRKSRGPLSKAAWQTYLVRAGRYEEVLSGNQDVGNRLLNLRARILLEQGQYKTVTELKPVTPDLKNTCGLAFYYLGETRRAVSLFNQVLENPATPLQRGSAYNYRGLVYYSKSDIQKARADFEEARRRFEQLEDRQPLVSALMNLGALAHYEGRELEALGLYEQSLKLARGIEHLFLTATLLGNLANLYIGWGVAKSARVFLAESKKLTETLSSDLLQGRYHLLAGDLAQLDNQEAEARAHYERALQLFGQAGLAREEGIAKNNLADLDQQKKDLERAAKPDDPEARTAFDSLWQRYEKARVKTPNELQSHLDVSPLWRRVLELQKKFSQEDDPVKIENLKKLLQINKRMTEVHDLDGLLEYMMDAVIQITGAERGFVIFTPDAKKDVFNIRVARNLDQETIRKPTYKISRTLVLQVLKKKVPLLTTDAEADPRLSQAKSVQGLRLKSILCVPLLFQGRVLGAIYVENRFARGIFTPDHAELLAAFADQAAIAIENARLAEENHSKAQNIESLNERLKSLLAEKTLALDTVTRSLEEKQKTIELKYRYENIVGESAALRQVLALLDRVTDRPISVLVTGESGTGKELIARALHYNSIRKDREFVAVNCSAIPANLLESELFGYVKGAFTGADRDHAGLIETAHGGTLFLDEIGDMPLEMQAKLLRVLQEREVRRVGSSRKIAVDIRLVCATHKNLAEACARKKFRQDLYYRIKGVEVTLPPLTARREDIPLLAAKFLAQFSPDGSHKFSSRAMDALVGYDWPGNVRELSHEIERAVALADGEIGPEHFSETVRKHPADAGTTDIRESRRAYERSVIVQSLEDSKGNKSLAAKRLGLSRVALYQKMRKLGVQVAS